MDNPYQPPSAPLRDDEVDASGKRRLFFAVALVVSAELLHAVLSSVAAGSIYPAAVFRFALIAALGIALVISRANWCRWIIVVLGTVWVVGYAYQAASRMSFDLAVVAVGLAAGIVLLVTKPVSECLSKSAA